MAQALRRRREDALGAWTPTSLGSETNIFSSRVHETRATPASSQTFVTFRPSQTLTSVGKLSERLVGCTTCITRPKAKAVNAVSLRSAVKSVGACHSSTMHAICPWIDNAYPTNRITVSTRLGPVIVLPHLILSVSRSLSRRSKLRLRHISILMPVSLLDRIALSSPNSGDRDLEDYVDDEPSPLHRIAADSFLSDLQNTLHARSEAASDSNDEYGAENGMDMNMSSGEEGDKGTLPDRIRIQPTKTWKHTMRRPSAMDFVDEIPVTEPSRLLGRAMRTVESWKTLLPGKDTSDSEMAVDSVLDTPSKTQSLATTSKATTPDVSRKSLPSYAPAPATNLGKFAKAMNVVHSWTSTAIDVGNVNKPSHALLNGASENLANSARTAAPMASKAGFAPTMHNWTDNAVTGSGNTNMPVDARTSAAPAVPPNSAATTDVMNSRGGHAQSEFSWSSYAVAPDSANTPLDARTRIGYPELGYSAGRVAPVNTETDYALTGSRNSDIHVNPLDSRTRSPTPRSGPSGVETGPDAWMKDSTHNGSTPTHSYSVATINQARDILLPLASKNADLRSESGCGSKVTYQTLRAAMSESFIVDLLKDSEKIERRFMALRNDDSLARLSSSWATRSLDSNYASGSGPMSYGGQGQLQNSGPNEDGVVRIPIPNSEKITPAEISSILKRGIPKAPKAMRADPKVRALEEFFLSSAQIPSLLPQSQSEPTSHRQAHSNDFMNAPAVAPGVHEPNVTYQSQREQVNDAPSHSDFIYSNSNHGKDLPLLPSTTTSAIMGAAPTETVVRRRLAGSSRCPLPGLWFAKVGLGYSDVVDVSFRVDNEIAKAAQEQRQQQEDSMPIDDRLIAVHLMCLSKSLANAVRSRLPPSAPPKAVADAIWAINTEWPSKGSLILHLNQNTEGEVSWIPATDAGPLDITDHVQAGTNTLRFTTLGNLSEYFFVLHAAVPSPALSSAQNDRRSMDIDSALDHIRDALIGRPAESPWKFPPSVVTCTYS